MLEAAYVRSDGTTPATPTRGVGLLATFGQGSAPQKGATMLALSTGVARDANDPNACGYQTCQHTTGDGDVSSNANPGLAPGGGFCDQGAVCYPVDAPGCSTTDGEVNDDIGLRVKLRAPTNATGFRYKFRFFSFEFPEYVCSSFNDQYVALMSPPPAGAVNSNISFDAAGNAVSVNVGFFDVCDPAAAVNYAQFGSNKPLPNPFCPAGPGDLVGTGFAEWGFGADDAGATVWLQSTAPVVGGAEFELLFTIWDTSDFAYDSTVLVDGFEWIANGGTVSVVTEPPPN